MPAGARLKTPTAVVDLHILGTSPAVGIGTPIATVADDFDGDARKSPPDIGADDVHPVVPFTDDPLSAGVIIKAAHVTELRARINAQRARFGLAPYVWSDAGLTGSGTFVVRAAHLAQMRTALNDAYAAHGTALPAYDDAVITPGVTVVRAVHINQLRASIVALEGTP